MCWASLVVQMIRNPPAKQETQILSLGREDPLEKGKATVLPKVFTFVSSSEDLLTK